MNHHKSHLAGAGIVAFPPNSDENLHIKRVKKRGGYTCGRCGLPKKGHTCSITAVPTVTEIRGDSPPSFPIPNNVVLSPKTPSRPLPELSFNDNINFMDNPESDDAEETDRSLIELDLNVGDSGLPARCLWEVMRRLPPPAILKAARVCRGWREITRKIWRAAEELRLQIPPRSQIGFIGSVLQKCPGLVRLSLAMHCDLDATVLACIAFSCPNLNHLEISMSNGAVNWLTGAELGRFVADRRYLSCLKVGGCRNIGNFNLSSSSLSILWLSELHFLSKMVINCPNLVELSLDFCYQENDSTDLTSMVNGLGRTCPRLMNLHIASVRLCHSVVLALAAANWRELRMLSLVHGLEITDASVASIVSSYSNLELLDLSGSSITDSGIGMMCNYLPESLSRLLVALCPNITSSGLQFATAQLPLLEVMDCGMSISDPNFQTLISEDYTHSQSQKMFNCKPQLYQKLIIKHGRLKKLSLWGCSGLDALYLNCPELNDLNLTSCTNLHPERLVLQCPCLGSVYASGCPEMLVGAIETQVKNKIDAVGPHFDSCSKRIQAPHLLQQKCDDEKKEGRRVRRRSCVVVD